MISPGTIVSMRHSDSCYELHGPVIASCHSIAAGAAGLVVSSVSWNDSMGQVEECFILWFTDDCPGWVNSLSLAAVIRPGPAVNP